MDEIRENSEDQGATPPPLMPLSMPSMPAATSARSISGEPISGESIPAEPTPTGLRGVVPSVGLFSGADMDESVWNGASSEELEDGGANEAATSGEPPTGFVPLMPLSMPLGGPGFTPPPPNDPTSWASVDGSEPPRRVSGRRRLVAAIAAVALVAGGAGAAIGVITNSDSSSSPPSAVATLPTSAAPTANTATGTNIVTSVAAAVTPAIVDIQTTIATQSGASLQQAAGTGMIVTSSGEVLTNNHVIAEATTIKVTIQGHKGTYNARVLGTDAPPSSDVALLQIEGFSGTLPYVTLGDSSQVKVGQPVVAIGNALGLGGSPSVVNGIVSAVNRTITASDSTGSGTETLYGMIQTDAPIAPGDSGGPLVNAQGQVIGMDTAAYSASTGTGTTFGFAIPINTARNIITSIEHGQATNGIVLGESPYMGIFEQVSTPSVGFGFGTSGVSGSTGTTGNSGATVVGVTIGGVAINSPAQTAGLAAGDTITSMNGKATASWPALTKIVSALHPGSVVSVSYTDTTGVPHTVSLTLTGIPK